MFPSVPANCSACCLRAGEDFIRSPVRNVFIQLNLPLTVKSVVSEAELPIGIDFFFNVCLFCSSLTCGPCRPVLQDSQSGWVKHGHEPDPQHHEGPQLPDGCAAGGSAGQPGVPVPRSSSADTQTNPDREFLQLFIICNSCSRSFRFRFCYKYFFETHWLFRYFRPGGLLQDTSALL